MKFVYGSYEHDANSVAFTSVKRSFVDGSTGRHNLLRVDWSLKGKIIRANQDLIMDQLAILQQAYSIGNQSAGMFDNNGDLIPAFFLDTTLAVGGVVVTNPISHEEISGAHGTTYLKYTFGLQADFLGPAALLSFQETLSFSDINGGPLQVERIPAQGSPILQNVTEQSWYYATQSGSLTQCGPNLLPVAPIWPEFLRGNDSAKSITYTSPKTIRGSAIEVGVQWKYEFISAYPLVGQVHSFG